MRVVSLFSGVGGLDLGFIRRGHEVVWANDFDHDAAMTYKKNIGDHIVIGDIRNIKVEDIPSCDMVIGGFPCQGFSVANMNRHATDSRNQLYLEMLKVIAAKRPKFFLAENVKGLTTLERGEVLKMILRDFSDLGYKVSWRVLNAADFGVPQVRKRVIIIGARNDLDFPIEFPRPTHSDPALQDATDTKPWVTVGSALKGIPEPEDAPQLYNHTCSKYKLRFNGYIGHRRMDPDKPAPTVTARGDDKGGVVVLHHPGNHRRMSARELATVQSFPIDFEFYGCRSHVYRQIGNAVPPLLAEAVASVFPLEG